MFEPSEHLWQVWGLILNVILPLLTTYWGFSALGRGVSPNSCSSTTTELNLHVSCSGGPPQEQGLWVQQIFWRRSPLSSLPPPQFGLRSNNREHSPYPSTENLIKDWLSMAPYIRTRPSLALSQFFPSRSFCKPLILLHQRTDRMKATVTEN